MSWLDYHPLIGPFRESNGSDGEDASYLEEGGGEGNGPLPGGLYDNGLPGDSMCSACGHAETGPGEDCEVCGGTGTGISKNG